MFCTSGRRARRSSSATKTSSIDIKSLITAPSNARPHATRIEHALGIETFLDALVQRGKARVLRLEHIDRGAQRRRRAYQRGVAAKARHRVPDRAGIWLVGKRHRRPD